LLINKNIKLFKCEGSIEEYKIIKTHKLRKHKMEKNINEFEIKNKNMKVNGS